MCVRLAAAVGVSVCVTAHVCMHAVCVRAFVYVHIIACWCVRRGECCLEMMRAMNARHTHTHSEVGSLDLRCFEMDQTLHLILLLL